MTASDMPFASAFPPVEEARWKELATAALKGAPFEKLVAKTYDGAAIQPLYRPASGAWDGAFLTGPSVVRGPDGLWRVYYAGAGTTVGIGIVVGLFFVLLVESFQYAHRVVGPRLHQIEANGPP